MKIIALTIAGQEINAPAGIPTGGFDSTFGNTVLSNLLQIGLTLAAILVLIYLSWAGIQWITSGGDKQKVANARNRITYAIIGLVVIALAIFIVNLVLYFLGGKTLGSS
jgi:membrane protease YdiL (CAAX protease family)